MVRSSIQAEKVEGFFADLQRIVPAFEQSGLVEAIPDVVEFAGELMGIGRQLFFVAPDGEPGRFKHVEHEHGVVGGQRASAFSDDVGLGEVVLGAGIDKGRHGIIGIFLNGIVHGAFG